MAKKRKDSGLNLELIDALETLERDKGIPKSAILGAVTWTLWPPRCFRMGCGISSNRSFRFQNDDHGVEDRASLIERVSPAFSLSSAAASRGRCCHTNWVAALG